MKKIISIITINNIYDVILAFKRRLYFTKTRVYLLIHKFFKSFINSFRHLRLQTSLVFQYLFSFLHCILPFSPRHAVKAE